MANNNTNLSNEVQKHDGQKQSVKVCLLLTKVHCENCPQVKDILAQIHPVLERYKLPQRKSTAQRFTQIHTTQ